MLRLINGEARFFVLILINFLIFLPFMASAEIRDIFFPTDPSVTFIDDFGDPRYLHTHEAIDLMGEQMMPLYAAVDGQISSINIPEKSWGYALTIRDSDSYTYHYLHINNDTPGTDDGNGGVENAYAAGIKRGTRVTRGQLVGWMGDSGNAETAGDHLHFEIRKPGGTAINPYASLVAALDPISYSPSEAMVASPDINTDKNLVEINDAPCESGTRIKLADSQAVYYCGADGKRYVFTNDKVYFSWYADFDDITVLTPEEMASVPLGGNITYRPGVKMVKIQTDPKVYALERGGVLRHIISPEIAESLYGSDWKEQVDDVPDAFFMDYTIGEPILSARE